MATDIEIRTIKISQEFYTVEYRLLDVPVNGQVSIPIGEWDEDTVTKAIIEDIKNMKPEIEMLRKLITEWEGKKITLDV